MKELDTEIKIQNEHTSTLENTFAIQPIDFCDFNRNSVSVLSITS